MKEINAIKFKDELIKATYLSEKHIDKFINHLSNRMSIQGIELSDLAILFANEKANGTSVQFATNFIGAFHLSTFATFMSLVEYHIIENN